MNRVIAVCILCSLGVLAAAPLVAAQDTQTQDNVTNTTENATQGNVTNQTEAPETAPQENETSISTVIIASATNYPDALVASSAAEKTGSPILIAGEEAVEGAATNDTATPGGAPIGNETGTTTDNQTDQNTSGDGGGLLGGLGGNDQQDADTMQIVPGVAAQDDGLLGGPDADNMTTDNATGGNDTPENQTMENMTADNDTVEEETAAIEGAAVQSLAPETRGEIEQLDPDEIVLVGGPQVLGTNISESLEEENYDVTRLWGYTRYGTAVEVANYFWPEGADSAMLVENERQSPDFPTVASAAELAEHEEQPMYLTPEGQLPAATLASLHHLDVRDVTVVGTNVSDDYEQNLEEADISIDDEITANDSAGLRDALWTELQDMLSTTDQLVVTASEDYHHAIAAASDPVMTTVHVSENATPINDTGTNETAANMTDTNATGTNTTGPALNESNVTANQTGNQTENATAVNTTDNQTENETDPAQMQVGPLGTVDDNDTADNETGNATNLTENQSASERALNQTTENETQTNETVAAEEATAEGLPLDAVLAEVEDSNIENVTVVGTETAGQNVATQMEDAGVNVTTILGPSENVSQLNREFIDQNMARFEDASQRWQETRDELLDEEEDEIRQRIATLMVMTERMMGEDAPQDATNSLERAAQRLQDEQYWDALRATMDARNAVMLDRFQQIAGTDAFDTAVDAEMWTIDQIQQQIADTNQAFADAFENESLEVQLWIAETVRHMTGGEMQQVFDQTMETWDDGDDLLPHFEQARAQVQTGGESGSGAGGPDGNVTAPGNQTVNTTEPNSSWENTSTDEVNTSTVAMTGELGGLNSPQFVTDTRCLTGDAQQDQEIRVVDSTILAAGNVILPTPNFNGSSNVTVDDEAHTVDIQINFMEGDGIGIQCVGEGAFVQSVPVDSGNWDVDLAVGIESETAWTAEETVRVPEATDGVIQRGDGNRSMITNETRSGTL